MQSASEYVHLPLLAYTATQWLFYSAKRDMYSLCSTLWIMCEHDKKSRRERQ